MSTLDLTASTQFAVTTIPNIFLDKYMPSANGEFVKVYLYLLRSLTSNSNISVSLIADSLNHTEADVLRALKYWNQIGLISLSFSPENKLTGINIVGPESSTGTDSGREAVTHDTNYSDIFSSANEAAVTSEHIEEPVKPQAAPAKPAVKEKHVYTASELETFTSDSNIEELLFVIQKYIGKTLSSSDINSILYIYDGLGFSVDLIEYLIEYCVTNSHKSMRYIEKVALSWADENISTVEQAKCNTLLYSKSCYPVLKAFGLNGRNPGESEKAFIVKWTNSYGFSMDIILDACNRTIQTIHQPSFEYADSILSKWCKKGIHKLDDIKRLDEEYVRKKEAKPASISPKAVAVKNTFNDFSQRTYDYDALEKKILANR